MCGIAGVYNPEYLPNESLLISIGDTMIHRGPDAQQCFINRELGIIHRRLSIIDLEGGNQPIFNEDKSLAIICNGEIYDFIQLRDELIKRGHSFSTESDSEVILHLYEEKGVNCLEGLNGMFAFAIVHLDSNKIFLARDRFGQKPLFYSHKEDKFAFASGPSALQKLDWVSNELNFRAIHDYLEFHYLPQPSSIYQDINKLAPGHYAVWENETLRIDKYWTANYQVNHSISYDEAREELSTLLNKSVRRRLISDVPLGAFLSGGLDSSIISALSQVGTSKQLSTFSIGFPVKKYDERDYAEQVAWYLGTDHHFLEVKADSFDTLIRKPHDFSICKK